MMINVHIIIIVFLFVKLDRRRWRWNYYGNGWFYFFFPIRCACRSDSAKDRRPCAKRTTNEAEPWRYAERENEKEWRALRQRRRPKEGWKENWRESCRRRRRRRYRHRCGVRESAAVAARARGETALRCRRWRRWRHPRWVGSTGLRHTPLALRKHTAPSDRRRHRHRHRQTDGAVDGPAR